jgi:hypothetical protein
MQSRFKDEAPAASDLLVLTTDVERLLLETIDSYGDQTPLSVDSLIRSATFKPFIPTRWPRFETVQLS